jgi:hypothetical protein
MKNVKSRQTIFVLHDLNVLGAESWNTQLNFTYVPDEVIVRSIRYLSADHDEGRLSFITTDCIKNSHRQILGEFSADCVLESNTTFDSDGKAVTVASRMNLVTLTQPESHFQFKPEMANGSASFSAMDFDGTKLVPTQQAGLLSLHLEFIEYEK